MKGKMDRLLYTYEQGYTMEPDYVLIDQGEVVLNMGRHSANHPLLEVSFREHIRKIKQKKVSNRKDCLCLPGNRWMRAFFLQSDSNREQTRLSLDMWWHVLYIKNILFA